MQLRRLRALAAAAAGTLIWAGSAHAATTDFADLVPRRPIRRPPGSVRRSARRASAGPAPTGIPGNVTDKVTDVRASGENTGGGEVKENLVDGAPDTKWLVFEPTGWVEFDLDEPVTVVHYALTSANDAAAATRRLDPPGLQRRQDLDDPGHPDRRDLRRALPDQGVRLRQHDRVSALPAGHHPQQRRRHPAARRRAVLDRRRRSGARAQGHALASSTAARAAPTAKAGAGFTGKQALRYAGTHTGGRPRATRTTRSSTSTSPSTADTELSYRIFPSMADDDLRLPSHLRRPSTWPSPTAPT